MAERETQEYFQWTAAPLDRPPLFPQPPTRRPRPRARARLPREGPPALREVPV